jgi:hypothetical protein
VAPLADGGFVVAYRVMGVGVMDAVLGQRYDNLGQRYGQEFVAAGPHSISNYFPAVAGLKEGGFVLTWTGTEDDFFRDDDGIFGQRFTP